MRLRKSRKARKPTVFSCGEVEVEVEGEDQDVAGEVGSIDVWVTRGDDAVNMLENCAQLVDIEAAEAAVEGKASHG